MEFKPYPKKPTFLVGEDGTIIGPSGKILKWSADQYPRVSLYPASVKGYVHIMVAETYLGPKPFAKAMVLHRDDDKQNNHHSNLKWGTATENNNDRYRNKALASQETG